MERTMASGDTHNAQLVPKVVVATTVALSFISLWRAAAVILGDLASTMFYVGGIAAEAIGPAAPWVVIAVMLFSFAIRSIYLESCGMFVRGGVYVVVRDALGHLWAKFSVSALMVDYVLTGPISSISAGHYLAGLLNSLGQWMGYGIHVSPDGFSVVFALAITAYFWRLNLKGVPESSLKALRILQITTVMVVVVLIWAPLTMVLHGGWHFPPAPTPQNLRFGKDALGWLAGTRLPTIGSIAVLIAFGHTLLALSGFETLAQIYREVAYPKLRNLKRIANFVCFYALLSTGLIILFAVMLIPPATLSHYYSNLIAGLAMNLAGPYALRLAFQAFVVIVGALILSSGVNTAIIGANGVMNRVAEDGVLHSWFRHPHPRYGTTSRLINLIVGAQIITILLSRGDVYLLGEAYAFGVIWSFAVKGAAVFALRFQRHDQTYKVPLNPRIGGREIPLGLALITALLFLVAFINLFTKQIATIYGITFSLFLFGLFAVSERLAAREGNHGSHAEEEFNLVVQPELDAKAIHARPGCVVVAVRDYTSMLPLKWALEKTSIRRQDIVVLTIRPLSSGAAEYELTDKQLFGDLETHLFTRVVAEAEKEGKHVELLVAPAANPFDGMVRVAAQLKCSRLVTGVSPRMAAEELSRRIGLAWEELPEPRHPFTLTLIRPDQPPLHVDLGPHPPRLWPDDVARVHDLWLRLSQDPRLGSGLHHRDVVAESLRRMDAQLDGNYEAIVAELQRRMGKAEDNPKGR
jgi:amino acid transporter